MLTGETSCDGKSARAIMVGTLKNEASSGFNKFGSVGEIVIVGMWFHFAVVVESGHVVVSVGLVGGADRSGFKITGQSVRMVAIVETNGINGNGVEIVDGRGFRRGGRIGRDAYLDHTEDQKTIGELIRGFEGEVSGCSAGVAADGVGFGGGREAERRLTGGDAQPRSRRHGEIREKEKEGKSKRWQQRRQKVKKVRQ